MSINQINRSVEFVAILGDLIILIFLFFLLSRFGERVFLLPAYTCTPSLMLTSLGVCYLACCLSWGRVWNSREIRADQLVLRILKNTIKFSIFWACVMTLGGITIISLPFFIAYFCILFVVLSIYRIIIRHQLIDYCAKRKHKHRVVFVGSGDNMQMLLGEMDSSLASIYEVAGYLDIVPNPDFSSKCSYLGNPDGLADFLSRHPDIRYVFCSLSMDQRQYFISIANYCENHLLHFHGVPNVCTTLPRRFCLSMVGRMPVLNLRYEPLGLIENRLMKRVFDVVLSGLFLVTIFPFIFLIIGIIIKITSPGPILFKQKRTGLDGMEFCCYKFRSMKVNKDADSKQATANDSRKTGFGAFLRRSNIDELPQFINVFRGEMSIVGPRPHMLLHTKTYARIVDKYMVRHFIKPGITGWAQTRGLRGETRELALMEERIKADIWYMEHWTLMLDLFIIYKTIINAFVGEKNAY
jgi:putative colanic acid biosynthesis UDP-glucose lipid carrier transferase